MGHSGRTDEPAGSGGAVLTRRDLLELAGLAFATTAIPPVAAFAEAVGSQDEAALGVSPVMDKLSRYMKEACERGLPDEVVEKAKHHIVDTLAAMISGSEIRPGHAAIEFVRAYGGKEVATVVASNIVCGPIEAALANGVLAHADETDDSHGPSRSHPGVSVVPAALAAGEQFGISGKHFLR
ncbi:MAG: MmgE/PrpD family protein, partial [Acidobacteria bacterium]